MFDKMNMRLNGLSDETFGTRGEDSTVAGVSRNAIISSGRLLTAEYIGEKLNTARGGKATFRSRCTEKGVNYAEMSKKHLQDKAVYCAAMAYAAYGKALPTDFNQVKNDQSLRRDPIFLRAMSEIDSEVISPLLYSVYSDIGDRLMNMSTVPLGQTKEITVLSNEAFLFEDSSWGSSRSTTKNYLYNDTITLTPSPKTANATIKWFQMIGVDNGMDAGWYYAAIMQGMYSKIFAIFTQALTAAAANSTYMPSYLTFSSYNSANWASATVAAAAANGMNRNSLMAFGAFQALAKVLPSGTSADAALTYNLGPEWMRDGFLGTVGGVPLYEVQQAMVPGTVNTTGTMVFPTDMIFIVPRVGESLAPVYGAFAEGSPITIEMQPSETADFTIDINVTAVFDAKAVMASKIAVIDNV